MAVTPSLWLSALPHPSARAAAAASAVVAAQAMPSMVLGVVEATPREEPALPAGWVRVGVPHTAPTSTVTGRTDGGLTAVGAVVAVLLDQQGRPLQITSPISLPEGAAPVPMGVLGARVEEAMVSGGGTTVLRLDHEPTAQDADGHPAGTHAWVYPTKALTGRVRSWWVWDGSVWARQEMAPELIVPYVTTDMLTAGKATIAGTAVVGDLVGNNIRGARMEGGRFDLDGAGPERRDVHTPSRWVSTGGDLTLSGEVPTLRTTEEDITRGVLLRYPGALCPTTGTVVERTVQLVLRSTTDQTVRVLVHPHEPLSTVTGDVRLADVRLEAGQDMRVSISMGDGAPSPQGDVSVQPTRPGVLEVRNYWETWRPHGVGNLTIRRSPDGEPVIGIAGLQGTVALMGDRLRYVEAGTLAGATSWRTLVAPPRAILRWKANAGGNAGSRVDGGWGADLAAEKRLENGFTLTGGWLVVPVAGWYQVRVTTGWLWATTQPSWAVASGIYRASTGSIDWDRSPADTRTLIPGITTTPTAHGLTHLDAGERITLGFWQNTGLWRPNSGLQTLEVMLIDAD